METIKNPMFNFKILKTRWWENLLLKFKPVYHIGIDPAVGGDYSVKCYIKRMFGKDYITKIERLNHK